MDKTPDLKVKPLGYFLIRSLPLFLLVFVVHYRCKRISLCLTSALFRPFTPLTAAGQWLLFDGGRARRNEGSGTVVSAALMFLDRLSLALAFFFLLVPARERSCVLKCFALPRFRASFPPHPRCYPSSLLNFFYIFVPESLSAQPGAARARADTGGEHHPSEGSPRQDPGPSWWWWWWWWVVLSSASRQCYFDVQGSIHRHVSHDFTGWRWYEYFPCGSRARPGGRGPPRPAHAGQGRGDRQFTF